MYSHFTDTQLGLWLINEFSWDRHGGFLSRFLHETKLEQATENSDASKGSQGPNPPGTCVSKNQLWQI